MLLQIEALSFGYDDKNILEDINLTVNEGDFIGFVGANGGGKSTLLNLINRELVALSGNINIKKNLSIGYLKQNSGLDKNITVYEEMKSVFTEIENAISSMREIEKILPTLEFDSSIYRENIAKYNNYNNIIDASDGYNIDVKIKTVLNGLGFSDKYNQIISTMSGGEKTRLALAKLLISAPELLLLDEPTNHLDLKTLSFLEGFLQTYKGAVIIVSHDRYFLDKSVSKIWDLDGTYIRPYRGNYTKYKQLKAELIDFQTKEYEKQNNRISSMLEYAEKNIVRATTSKSAKSRLHQIENIELLEKPITKVPTPVYRFDYEFEPVKNLLSVNDYTLKIEDKILVENINFEVKRKDKYAIIGDNGTGKSTLIKRLMENKDSKIKFGNNVKIAYYDQENLNINFENTVIDELWGKFMNKNQTEVRSILAKMLLTNEDMTKKISLLSGGERAKLGFALIMAERGNTLILDEPTNHLDLPSREALEQALLEFDGTIIFVSHDRYFLNKLSTKVLELSNNTAKEFVGNYEDYLAVKNSEMILNATNEDETTYKSQKSTSYRTKAQRQEEVKLNNDIKNIEENITQTENAIETLNTLISTPSITQNYQLLNEKCKELDLLKSSLDNLYKEWESLFSKKTK